MRIDGTAAYSTVIASVNNRNATTAAAPSHLSRNSDQNRATETRTSHPQGQQLSLSATIETSGRKTTLSPLISDRNLPPQTQSALNSYVNIQNQLQSDEQTHNQQLLGVDIFA
ncbi:MAG: hypothetical protein DRQ56_08885 [Gammaproteobacteria bacterium]|nr:MAG: hypothetical protein DRQ56_08885 [Gammaproteobacteria bacterium]